MTDYLENVQPKTGSDMAAEPSYTAIALGQSMGKDDYLSSIRAMTSSNDATINSMGLASFNELFPTSDSSSAGLNAKSKQLGSDLEGSESAENRESTESKFSDKGDQNKLDQQKRQKDIDNLGESLVLAAKSFPGGSKIDDTAGAKRILEDILNKGYSEKEMQAAINKAEKSLQTGVHMTIDIDKDRSSITATVWSETRRDGLREDDSISYDARKGGGK